MRLKNKFLLLLFVVLYSCDLYNNPTIYGPYKTRDNSLLSSNTIKDVSIDLKSDKTYILTTCSQTTHGHWTIEKDKLFLFCEKIRFNIDSINLDERYAKGTICDTLPDVYLIQDDKLSKKLKINNKDYSINLYK